PKGRIKTAVRAEPARPQERRRKRRHLAGRAIVQARFPQGPDQDGRTGRARTASRTAPQAAPSSWTSHRSSAIPPRAGSRRPYGQSPHGLKNGAASGAIDLDEPSFKRAAAKRGIKPTGQAEPAPRP